MHRVTLITGLVVALAVGVVAVVAAGSGAAAEQTPIVVDERASVLPSGRTTYRVYDDYVREMRALVRAAPSLVTMRSIGTTHEGRPIWALEIADGVGRDDDGRPVAAHYGLIHAREWPSGEYLIEFARTLVQRHRAGDARVGSALRDARVVLVPVLNVDGFIASRQSAAGPTVAPAIVSADGEYRRKNCRPNPRRESIPCALRDIDVGVDLNRNFPAYWGGAGASRVPRDETYAGPGAASEPETRAWRDLLRSLQATVVIGHHTYTDDGAVLRQPGFRDPDVWPEGPIPADEPTTALSEAVVNATGWRADTAYGLGDMTGASDDWNYVAQGALVLTTEARGRDFHGDYREMVVAAYTGTARGARGGVREALLRSVEIAAQSSNHAIIEGTAPAGALLQLERRVSVPVCDGATSRDACVGPVAGASETFRSTLRVPASGRFRWHVNPADLPLLGERPWGITCVGVAARGSQRTIVVRRGGTALIDFGAAGCGGAVAERPAKVGIRTTLRGDAGGSSWVLRAVFEGAGRTADSAAITWDLDGDGTTDRTGRSVTWTPTRAGARAVTVRARSAAGIVTATKTLSTPAARVPRVVASARRIAPGGAVVLRVPHDVDGEPPRVTWDLDGDGAFDDGAGTLVARRYADAGRYRVTARVVTPAGRVSTPRITLLVRP